jgi:hypothetical protein
MATYVFLITLTEKGKSHFEEVRNGGKELSDTLKTAFISIPIVR